MIVGIAHRSTPNEDHRCEYPALLHGTESFPCQQVADKLAIHDIVLHHDDSCFIHFRIFPFFFCLPDNFTKGTLKASRVVQLRKIAEETGSERFMEGVQIIEEAYQPAISKQFVRAEMKNENGKWVCIPLGMTES